MTHDQIISRLLVARDGLTRPRVAAAFAAGVGQRLPEGCSALGSYAAMLHLEAHAFQLSQVYAGDICKVCGLKETITTEEDALFEEFADRRRTRRGQIRHTNALYAMFDLETFTKAPALAASDANWELLRALLDRIAALPAQAQLAELHKPFAGLIRSNKIERQHLLEILGFCGILCPPDQQSDTDCFLGYETRESRQPNHFFKREWAYPVQHWTGAAGVNRTRVAWWFGPRIA